MSVVIDWENIMLDLFKEWRVNHNSKLQLLYKYKDVKDVVNALIRRVPAGVVPKIMENNTQILFDWHAIMFELFEKCQLSWQAKYSVYNKYMKAGVVDARAVVAELLILTQAEIDMTAMFEYYSPINSEFIIWSKPPIALNNKRTKIEEYFMY
jgi:hypothetical protein